MLPNLKWMSATRYVPALKVVNRPGSGRFLEDCIDREPTADDIDIWT